MRPLRGIQEACVFDTPPPPSSTKDAARAAFMPQWGVTRLSRPLLGCRMHPAGFGFGSVAVPTGTRNPCTQTSPPTHLPACLIIQQGALSTCSPRAARTMRGASASATAAAGAWARTTTAARLLLPGRTCTLLPGQGVPAAAWLRVCSCVCCILEQAGGLLAAVRVCDHSTCTTAAAAALQRCFSWNVGI